MKANISIENCHYELDYNQQYSLAITLSPGGQQPQHFGAPACESEVLCGDGFIGDTRQGGSCNVNKLVMIPHCNGTHTESVAHIVDQPFPVYRAINQSIFPCVVISVSPQLACDISESYTPGFDSDNLVITAAQLENFLVQYTDTQLTGLAIRTLPNTNEKKHYQYNNKRYPVYLTNDAMCYLVRRNIQHLMVDFPSVDKMYDEGKLSNHRIFWNIPSGCKQLVPESTPNKTITEMIFIKDSIEDGFYLCNLQIPEIETDAVPSRPVLFPVNKLN